MKTITIKQPWASLICEGIKDVENRTWNTKFRGRVLIHASCNSWIWNKVINYIYGLPLVYDLFTCKKFTGSWLKSLKTGAIIGSVEIVDCVINHPSIWAEKTTINQNTKSDSENYEFKTTYNWVLANPIMFLEPIAAKGKLSFWDYPGILAEPEENGGELFCHCQLPVKEINQVTGYSDDYRCRYCGGKWYK